MNKKHLILTTALLVLVTKVNLSFGAIKDFIITLREHNGYNGLTTDYISKFLPEAERTLLKSSDEELNSQDRIRKLTGDNYVNFYNSINKYCIEDNKSTAIFLPDTPSSIDQYFFTTTQMGVAAAHYLLRLAKLCKIAQENGIFLESNLKTLLASKYDYYSLDLNKAIIQFCAHSCKQINNTDISQFHNRNKYAADALDELYNCICCKNEQPISHELVLGRFREYYNVLQKNPLFSAIGTFLFETTLDGYNIYKPKEIHILNKELLIDTLEEIYNEYKQLYTTQQPYTVINNIETLFKNYYKF